MDTSLLSPTVVGLRNKANFPLTLLLEHWLLNGKQWDLGSVNSTTIPESKSALLTEAEYAYTPKSQPLNSRTYLPKKPQGRFIRRHAQICRSGSSWEQRKCR